MIERLATVDAHEGPVHVDGVVYFTTLPAGGRVDIKRLALGDGRVSTVREDANMANGMALAPDGRLLVCEQGGHSRPAAITLVDPATGATETLVDRWRGMPLNSPNDVVVKRDGSVWFTDPSYGHLQGFRPEPALGDHVYRFDPASGELSLVADGFEKPNGLAFSPDERVLYVGDSEADLLEAFDVVDGSVANRRRFATIAAGHPDGVKVDDAGRVYTTGGAGVLVLDSAGRTVGEIPLPGAVNFAFGDGVLFVTTDDAIWAVDRPVA